MFLLFLTLSILSEGEVNSLYFKGSVFKSIILYENLKISCKVELPQTSSTNRSSDIIEYLILQLQRLYFLSLFPSSHLLLHSFLVTFLISQHQMNHKKITFPLNERQSINITLAHLLLRYFRFFRLYTSKGKEKGLLQSFNHLPTDIYKYKLT